MNCGKGFGPPLIFVKYDVLKERCRLITRQDGQHVLKSRVLIMIERDIQSLG
jgi:hypothetical protein